jgi:hypothetical protein
MYSAEQRVFISNTKDMNIYCYCMKDDVMVQKKKTELLQQKMHSANGRLVDCGLLALNPHDYYL